MSSPMQSQLKLGCVSGCNKGLVIHWDINTGSCISEFGMYKSPVVQLEPTIASVVGLFGEGCVRVWDIVTGNLLHTITLVSLHVRTYVLTAADLSTIIVRITFLCTVRFPYNEDNVY